MASGPRRRHRGWLLALAVTAAACGEPAVDLEPPERDPSQVVLDQAGILDTGVVEQALGRLADEGRDAVALTFTAEEVNLGLADRAGSKLLGAWDADLVLVAVAEPGHFTSQGQSRRRVFGVVPADSYAVPGSLRERIVSELVPPLAARNDWDGVFTTAAQALAEGLP